MNPIQIKLPVKTNWTVNECFVEFYIELLKLKSSPYYCAEYHWLKSRYYEFLNYSGDLPEDEWLSKHVRNNLFDKMFQKYNYFFQTGLCNRSIDLPEMRPVGIREDRTEQYSLF